MTTIGILGSYGGLNLGDEAILTASLASLRRARPDAELVVFSRNPEHTRRHHTANRVAPGRDVSRLDMLPELERLDLLLLGGGGILYDGEVRTYLRTVQLAQGIGIPTFAFAVGAGPLHHREDRRMVCETLARMDGITVRDEGSRSVLEDAGVEQQIEVTADPALLLEPEPFSTEMLEREGVTGDRLIGMSVREPGSAASHLDERAYHQLLAQAADFMVHRFDASIVFVPMERVDIRESHAVIAHMAAADRASVLHRRYEPAQVMGLMQQLDMVVGMRLHLLLFAAASHVPFLALPYAPKVAGLVRPLGVPSPPPDAWQSAGPLLALIDRLWDLRMAQRQLLRERVPALRERAAASTQLALERLRDASAGRRRASGPGIANLPACPH